MSTLKAIWDCMFAPKLIKIYRNGPPEEYYESTGLEKIGNQVIHSLYVIWKFGVYTSPFWVGILYTKGYFCRDGIKSLTELVAGIGVILVISYCCRGLGRLQNPTYTTFLSTLQSAKENLTPTIKQKLISYDFDFKSWPVEFNLQEVRGFSSTSHIYIKKPILHRSSLDYFLSIPFRIIAYLAIHTFGIRFIYPGSLGLLQVVLKHSLIQGRAKLIEYNRGERFKLLAIDGNEIDAMFVDRRNTQPNGNTLAICCEGNAGFYEIGIMITPIEAGYSVLGWNHPGFAGSTGMPYPTQEQNAIDAVIQFAIYKLGFKLENILLFGWSIGGYCTSWAAMNYPNVKGIIIDATFDDILPLALQHMPTMWGSIVRLAIREYVNLDISQHLCKYPGPILLIRRTEDEVICLRENDLSSNRGNNLLIKLFCARYPSLIGDAQIELLKNYLAVTSNAQDLLIQTPGVNENMCNSLLQSYISEYSKSYPMKIGEEFSDEEKNQMILFLARKYLKDYKSSHCVNLPVDMFQLPWDVHVESGYVFT